MTKSKSKLLAGTSLACLLSVTALPAQERSNSRTDSTGMARADHMMKESGMALKASDLIGMKVENTERQKIGEVEDLAIDLQSGRVVQVVLSTGGVLGMGQRHVAVPPGRVHFGAKNKPLHFDIAPERLKSAPAFDVSRWEEFYQSDRVKETDRYFGGEALTGSAGAYGVRGAVETSLRDVGYVQKATKLMGMHVRNLQDEKIGSVDNLIIDLPAGRVVAVIVSSGGFLGMGDALSAIPPAALRFTDNRDRLRLDTTKETLRDAPRFKAGEWPDFAQADYTAGVYRAYKLEPYSREGKNRAADADNSARNVRDRGDRTLTAGDQGGSESDVKMTQLIRKEVTAVDGFSVNAKNVKIITVNGRVTLRGPVKTAEEKSRIAEIAGRIARSENVDNQLEVAAR